MIEADLRRNWFDLFQASLAGEKLGTEERQAIERAFLCMRSYRRGETIVDHSPLSDPLHLVTRGWAARASVLEGGSRQITDFVLPGEFCDLSRLGHRSSQMAVAITTVRTALLERQAVRKAIEDHPKLGLALLRMALREQAILREWLVCLGRREKREHIAHLLCELHERLRRAGMVCDHEFDMPLTQEQIAEATGMTAVHTNRVIQRLRKDGIISFGRQHVRIDQPQQLRKIAEFDAAYLST